MKRFFTKHFTLFVILLAVLILLIILYQVGFLDPLSGALHKIFSPFKFAFGNISDRISGFYKVILTANSLQKENQELQKQVNELNAEVAKLKEVKVENEILRKQLGFSQHEDFNLISCEIISYEPSNFLKNFSINKGKEQGVLKGMPVVSSGLLVGKINEVGDDYSTVSQITDPDSRIGAIVQDTRASGIIKGQLGYGLIIESIPQDEIINSGQTVVTSGLGGEFPKGIIIGYIQDIFSKPNEVFQSATVQPAIDFKQLEIVFIITGSK